LSYASGVGATDPIKLNKKILENCRLGGSKAIKTNDSLFLVVSGKISALIEIKEYKTK
jgi:hypothetical protein